MSADGHEGRREPLAQPHREAVDIACEDQVLPPLPRPVSGQVIAGNFTHALDVHALITKAPKRARQGCRSRVAIDEDRRPLAHDSDSPPGSAMAQDSRRSQRNENHPHAGPRRGEDRARALARARIKAVGLLSHCSQAPFGRNEGGTRGAAPRGPARRVRLVADGRSTPEATGAVSHLLFGTNGGDPRSAPLHDSYPMGAPCVNEPRYPAERLVPCGAASSWSRSVLCPWRWARLRSRPPQPCVFRSEPATFLEPCVGTMVDELARDNIPAGVRRAGTETPEAWRPTAASGPSRAAGGTAHHAGEY